MTQGYLLGTWPPGERWLPSAVRVQNNLLAAHVSMYRAIHELQPDGTVGLAHHMRVVDPARPRRLGDRTGAALVRWGSEAFARAICEGQPPGPLAGLRFTRRRSLTAEARGTQDFFGLNYYTRSLVQFSPRDPSRLPSPRRPPRQRSLISAGRSIRKAWAVYSPSGPADPDEPSSLPRTGLPTRRIDNARVSWCDTSPKFRERWRGVSTYAGIFTGPCSITSSGLTGLSLALAWWK